MVSEFQCRNQKIATVKLTLASKSVCYFYVLSNLKLLWSFKKNHIYIPFFKNAPAIFFFIFLIFLQTASFRKEIKSKESKFDSKWFSVNSSVLFGVCQNARVCSSFFSASSFLIQKSQAQHFFFFFCIDSVRTLASFK